MNILENPPLLDQLAASYALGTLRGGARRRFEALARTSATVRASALIWQERFASLTELQASEAPSPNVWKRIQNLVALQAQTHVAPAAPPETPMFDRLRHALGLWRGAAFAGALAAVAAVLVGVNLNHRYEAQNSQLALVTQQKAEAARQNAQLAARLKAAPEIQYVSVLVDDKNAPSMLATFDPKSQTLTLKRVGDYREAPDKSLQLWAVPPFGKPESLGVLSNAKVIHLSAREDEVRNVPTLAITLEAKGGVPPGESARGPVVFKGALLQTTL
jgi:anti-sigma-K factor RskA